HNSPHGELTLLVGDEDFAHAARAVIPALQDGEMLHGFQPGLGFNRRDVLQRRLHPRFHRLRTRVILRLDRESKRLRDASSIHTEKRHASRDRTWLDDQTAEAINSLNDFRKLSQQGLELVETSVKRCRVFELEISRRLISLRRNFADERVSL